MSYVVVDDTGSLVAEKDGKPCCPCKWPCMTISGFGYRFATRASAERWITRRKAFLARQHNALYTFEVQEVT